MNITDLLIRDRILCCADIGSKKRLFERLGELLAGDSGILSPNDIFDALINREKLGSTGLGKGVAIPHGRIPALEKPLCAIIKLAEPVDFDATDNLPVDLVFALLVPEESTEEHLQVLSTIAEVFSNASVCDALRECDTESCIFEQLSRWEMQRTPA
jgi:PTS system nitrogen regulatory IIA component